MQRNCQPDWCKQLASRTERNADLSEREGESDEAKLFVKLSSRQSRIVLQQQQSKVNVVRDSSRASSQRGISRRASFKFACDEGSVLQ